MTEAGRTSVRNIVAGGARKPYTVSMNGKGRKVEIPEVCVCCGAADPVEAGGRWQCCGEPTTARPEAKLRWSA